MMAAFLIPKSVIETNGAGSRVAVGEAKGGLLQLTLEILSVVEQESIEVHLEGSADGETWMDRPLAAFPQKFYAGASVLVCDLGRHPEVEFVRASWKVNRWGRGSLKPRFELYLFGESVASGALDFK